VVQALRAGLIQPGRWQLALSGQLWHRPAPPKKSESSGSMNLASEIVDLSGATFYDPAYDKYAWLLADLLDKVLRVDLKWGGKL
jgi:hypothetical protein